MVLDPEAPGLVGQDITTLDIRGRLRIPWQLAKPIDWLEPTKKSCYALAIFEDPGRIMLCSWEKESPAVLEKRRDLLRRDAYADLRLLEDRYRRVLIPRDLRPTLGAGAVMHLGLRLDVERRVYVVRMANVLEILAPSYRDKQLALASTVFSGLP